MFLSHGVCNKLDLVFSNLLASKLFISRYDNLLQFARKIIMLASRGTPVSSDAKNVMCPVSFSFVRLIDRSSCF